jgi:hypothetical protein
MDIISPEQNNTTNSPQPIDIRALLIGAAKAATTDLPGFIGDVIDKVSGTTNRLGEKDRSGQMFKAATGLETKSSLEETIGGILGPGGAAKAMIVGAARLSKLRGNQFATEAELLLQDGLRNPSVYNSTGVYKDLDFGRKSVLSDSGTLANLPTPKDGTAMLLPDAIKNPELFSLYPELKNTVVTSISGAGGAFRPGAILIGAQQPRSEQTATLFHEIQHAVQHLEGFAKGGSPRSFMTFDEQAVKTAIAKGRMSKNPVTQQMVKDLEAKYSVARREATNKYLSLPGEQEARFTERTYDMPEDTLAKIVQNLLNQNQTPSNRTLNLPK